MTDKLELTDAEWREKLSPEQYHILREAGTERAFTGKYEKNKQAGEYHCAACGQLVFESEDKYDSGSGWPSFTAPADGDAVEEHSDTSLGCAAPKWSAPSARAISATSSQTDRDRMACAIASTAPRWISNLRTDYAAPPKVRGRFAT